MWAAAAAAARTAALRSSTKSHGGPQYATTKPSLPVTHGVQFFASSSHLQLYTKKRQPKTKPQLRSTGEILCMSVSSITVHGRRASGSNYGQSREDEGVSWRGNARQAV